jgi:hypothetical protein
MNEQQGSRQTAGENPKGRCVCEEVMGHLQDAFGISDDVRQHLKNSRIEFLKAIRSALDERIDRMSSPSRQGTRIPVE